MKKTIILILFLLAFTVSLFSQTTFHKKVITKQSQEGTEVITEQYNDAGYLILYNFSSEKNSINEEYIYNEKRKLITLSGNYDDEEEGEYTSQSEFIYDEKDRLIKEIISNGDPDSPNDIEYRYTENGKKPFQIIYKVVTSGSEFISSEIFLTYNDRDSISESESFTYMDTKKENFYREKKSYVYNEKFYLKDIFLLNENEEVNEHYIYEYNDSNKISREIHINMFGDTTIVYNFTYNPNNKLIKAEGSYSQETREIIYDYYENNLLKEESEFINGVNTYKVTYIYE